MSPPRPWSDLLPELLSQVLAQLRKHPVDVARFRVVCRAWHSAARQVQVQQQQPPWIVLPNAFSTIGGDDDIFLHRIPRLRPDDEAKDVDVTCVGASGCWLALDYIYLQRRGDVKHKHRYLLHNPFSGNTVPLPELDAIIGDDFPEKFKIRKVLMCSGSLEGHDRLVAITTNNKRYPIIVCRPGKGRWVLPNLDVFEVAFFGGGKQLLYGITPNEDLIAFDLTETKRNNGDGSGRRIVCKFKRVIRHPLADGEHDPRSWMDDIDDYYVLYDDEDYEDDENGEVPDGVDLMEDEEVPYCPKDLIITTRRLIVSCSGQELLMVRDHQVQSLRYKSAYTCKLEIFRADLNASRWVPVTDDDSSVPAQGEALFLSRSSSKAIHAYGDIKKGIYSLDTSQLFDTSSRAREPFSIPGESGRPTPDDKCFTWVFPPKLVV
ncbi:hypothetical protein BS78_K327000 [Paspalum vaginatum]|uniref:KIB1-4 beta-propeller domain-containing protein n=1 Tax=Paspalum vaginatum TaxID=158149 RepID=A0A9W8CEJ0_9POAL|nr:hypothetical protein BS78_K327000 [Paspalum vaginatum]